MTPITLDCTRTVLDKNDVLDGADKMPDVELSLQEVFRVLDEQKHRLTLH